jgi:hypothetical protein
MESDILALYNIVQQKNMFVPDIVFDYVED